MWVGFQQHPNIHMKNKCKPWSKKCFLAWRTWPHVIAGNCAETKCARCTTFQFSALSTPSKIFSLCKMVIQILLPIFRFKMKIEALRTIPESLILKFQRHTVPWDISLGSRIFILVCSVNRCFTSWRKQRECSDYYDKKNVQTALACKTSHQVIIQGVNIHSRSPPDISSTK